MQFIDLHAQRARLREPIDAAVARVLEHGHFIMGPEVAELEQRLASYCGVGHAVSCANGTDALVLALTALDVGPGDAVFVPTFTFAATAEAVALVGATPVFCDVLADTYNLDPASLEAAVEATHDLRPRGVIAVDLFGQPADYDAIEAIAGGAGLWTVADAAQSFGATWKGRRAGSLGLVATTSFFPAKPLGCYGDGGAIFTDDDRVADILRSLRVHGKGTDKYDNVRIGHNSRLDTLQAAILLQKLDVFDDELVARQRVAERYGELLGDVVRTPAVHPDATSAWAQYTVAADGRDDLISSLRSVGVPTAVYYPTPLHLQTAYRRFPTAPSGLKIAERAAMEVVSLPMHPYLDTETQRRIGGAVCAAVGAGSGGVWS